MTKPLPQPQPQPPVASAVPAPETNGEMEDLRSRWEKWAAKNALPKNHYFPRPKTSPSRFQKPGPMTEKDWRHFVNWAKKRTIPKKTFPPRPPEERPKKPLTKLAKRLQKLSKPRHPRAKYWPPPEPVYPFSPKIDWKKPPHMDKGRPFQPIKLPYWWVHEENEINFWRWMRFPISEKALKYRLTPRTKKMAIIRPIKVHCHIPDDPKDLFPPDRIKMSPKQWKEHLVRLEYLADASFKVTRQFRTKLSMK